MDAIIDSNVNGHWVKITSSAKSKDENPFWSSTEQSHQKFKENASKLAEPKKKISPDASKLSPKSTKREKVK